MRRIRKWVIVRRNTTPKTISVHHRGMQIKNFWESLLGMQFQWVRNLTNLFFTRRPCFQKILCCLLRLVVVARCLAAVFPSWVSKSCQLILRATNNAHICMWFSLICGSVRRGSFFVMLQNQGGLFTFTLRHHVALHPGLAIFQCRLQIMARHRSGQRDGRWDFRTYLVIGLGKR